MTEAELRIEKFEFAQGALILDARWFPVLVTTSVGEVEREGIEALCAWMDRMVELAVERDVAVVAISDSKDTIRPHKEDLRYIMERADARQARTPDRVLSGLVIVEGAIMRGVVALALWMGKHPTRMTTVATMETAIERARQLLVNAGIEVPRDLDALAEDHHASITRAS